MTVSTEVSLSGPYEGNGSTTVFNYDFKIFEDSDLVVRTIDTNGDETTLVLDTGYTVSGAGDDAGGSFTLLGTPLPANEYVYAFRDIPSTQLVDLVNQGAFYAQVHEDVFDRLTMLNQQASASAVRAIKLPVGDDPSESDTTLATAANRTDTYLAFDENGDIELESKTAISSAASSAATAASAANSAAAATSATNAATSETNAATSATSAATAQSAAEDARDDAQNYADGAASFGLFFEYDSTTTDADPGSGKFRLNHASPASATAIYIDDENTSGDDVTDWIATFDDSTTTTNRGELTFIKAGDTSTWMKFSVTAGNTDNSGYTDITVAYVDHAGTLTNGDDFGLIFSRTGDNGSGGVDNLTEDGDDVYLNTGGALYNHGGSQVASNTSFGKNALTSAGVGATLNTALGVDALASATNADRNTAVGYNALTSITTSATASDNTAIGCRALEDNTTGQFGTAVGVDALNSNTSGASNVAIGYSALFSNLTGGQNVAVGRSAGSGNTASENTFVGYNAGLTNTSGSSNTCLGHRAGFSNSAGSDNVLLGQSAGESTTGSSNTFVGADAGDTFTTGSNTTALGHDAQPSSNTVSDEFTLGDANVTNLRCNDTTISSLSDERDKSNIQPMEWGLDFIEALSFTTFDWTRRDGSMEGQRGYGLIAQQALSVVEQFGAQELNLVRTNNPDKLEAAPAALLPVMGVAIQQLLKRIEELEALVQANQASNG